MKLDILAIGAHPDDIELGCSGTMIKHVRKEKRVGICDLTAGELGTRGSPALRAKEAATSASLMGVSVRENLAIPDGHIENSPENREKLIRIIRRYRPAVLLIPYHADRHPDHEHAHVLAREAWFYAGLSRIETQWESHAQDPFRPRAYYCYMQWFEFPPTFIVDVTAEYEQRMKTVRAFKSQFYDPESQERQTVLSTPEFLLTVSTRLAYYGDKIGKKYGEPFFAPIVPRVDDICALNV